MGRETTIKEVGYNINRLLCYIKKNQRVIPEGDLIKVNIGCGLEVAPGWLNIDSTPSVAFSRMPTSILKRIYPLSEMRPWYSLDKYCTILRNHKFIYHDVRYGIPLPDRCADYIYSSHMLEHLFVDEAQSFLRGSFRVLKEGGILRICIPDLHYAVSQYLEGNKDLALSFFFSKEPGFCLHRYMYDFESLKQIILDAGFVSVNQCSFKKGETPDLDFLDNRPEETIYVEAMKVA